MKLVYISQEPPYPPYRDGGRLIHYNYVTRLARMSDVDLEYHYFFDPQEGDYLDEVRKEIKGSVHSHPLSDFQMRVNILKSIFHLPIKSPLKLDLSDHDVVLVDGFGIAWLGSILKHRPIIHFPHDSFSLLYRDKVLHWPMALVARLMEERVSKLYDGVIVVAERDATRFDQNKTFVLPNGVDTEMFDPKKFKVGKEGGLVAFSGVMDYGPNEDAVRWFVGKVWPIVKKSLPEARFKIIGRNPTRYISSLSSKDIVVTGKVDKMESHLANADVFVAPMVSGMGIKNKTLQALSMELPVVSTPRGRGGISKSEALLEAESPEEFAAAVVGLLKDSKRIVHLGKLGRAFVKKEYSWDKQTESLKGFAGKLLGAKRPVR